jgi:voltage-gated potassium channel Kch
MRKIVHLLGRSFLTVAVVYAIVVVLSAGLFDLAEAKYGIGDSLWWAFTTATTTGYGDMYPVTVVGRGVAIFLMHFGPGFAFPVMTAIMSAKLIVDSDAFTHAEQEAIKNDLAAIREMLHRQQDDRK